MAFSDRLKLEVKRRAHFSCGLCHALGVEVHHIVPQAESGDHTEDNAAPLCPSCHETYGANPEKRKFIREAREFWYEICAKRYATDPDRLDKVSELLKNAVTKSDLDQAIDRLTELICASAANETQPVQERAREVTRIGSMRASGVGAKDLPLLNRMVLVDTPDIKVIGVRITKQHAVLTWELPGTNQEVLRTRVDVNTGKADLESCDASYWTITINDIASTAADLVALAGRPLSINANPATKLLSVTTN